MYYNRKITFSHGVTLHQVGRSLYSLFSHPFLFACPPSHIGTFLAFIRTAVLSPAEFSGIFSSPLSVSFPFLSWNMTFGGVCIVQVVSYAFNVVEVRW